MNQDDGIVQEELFDAQLIPPHLAITAMRDSGYKNTAYALAELIDNSVQANASMIEVLCIEKRERVRKLEVSRLWKIAVLDNGSGMDTKTLRMALQFGNGTRLNDRSGIGRFGIGLPNASISQAKRVDVWSWQNGPENAIHTFIDLDKIEAKDMYEVPPPERDPVPEPWRGFSSHVGRQGTLVVWSNLDFERLTWKKSDLTLDRTEEIVGRIYRRFIEEKKVKIRLYAVEDGKSDTLIDRETEVNDPLYLVPSRVVPSPFDIQPMFEQVFDEKIEIEYNGQSYMVTTRYSKALDSTVSEAGSRRRGDMAYGKHAATNLGVSVLRAGREIMLDTRWCDDDTRERWWGAEVEFPPELDEIFGVTNNKQVATHFTELARMDWSDLAENGELFSDVVKRLKEEGDYRGWLLVLSDSIKRNLREIRELVHAQRKGSGSSTRKRHDDADADDATKTANEGWERRSEEQPLEEDKKTPTERDFSTIRDDLIKNKNYNEVEAEQLVSLIRDLNLKIVFEEADFRDSFNLFDVEMKGHITAIIFNRKHPAFEAIFGTISTDDEDMTDVSKEETMERLLRAVDATKIIFAAWARYEREAGVDRAQALERVRFDWGQMAAQFLQPDDALAL